MYEQGPLSRDLAQLIAVSLATYLAQADSFESAEISQQPAGVLKEDLAATSVMSPDVRDVRGRLLATGLDTVLLVQGHMVDHIRSLEQDLRRDPVPIWSTLTLARAVLESTALLCHLLDTSVSTEARLCRVAAQWLADTQKCNYCS